MKEWINENCLDEITVPIKQSTIDEVVECLENGREYIEVEHSRYKELNQYSSYTRGEVVCKTELDTIDKLINQLKNLSCKD